MCPIPFQHWEIRFACLICGDSNSRVPLRGDLCASTLPVSGFTSRMVPHCRHVVLVTGCIRLSSEMLPSDSQSGHTNFIFASLMLRSLSDIDSGSAPFHLDPGLYTTSCDDTFRLNFIEPFVIDIGTSIFTNMRLCIGDACLCGKM